MVSPKAPFLVGSLFTTLHQELELEIRIDIHDSKSLNECQIDFNPEFDDALALISSICEFIFEHDAATFNISGWGENNWPIDVLFDLPTFIEQLPVSLNLAKLGATQIEIDLYEQGIERQILFERKDDHYLVNAISNTGWVASESDIIDRSDLVIMLETVKNSFLQLADEIKLTNAARQEMQQFWQSF